MEMTQTWIIFTIDDQQVYQIEYFGCTGQDLIDGYKAMLAGTYKVSEADVKIGFKDDLMTQKPEMSLLTRVTSSELVKETKDILKLNTAQN